MRGLGLFLGLFRNGDGAVPMILTIDTTKAGTANNQFALPLTAGGSYKFSVDWGDGTIDNITTWNQAETTHTYASTGVYTVKIKGRCTVWSFNNGGDKLKVLSVVQWSNGTFTQIDFYGCTNLISVSGSASDYPRGTLLYRTFRDCTGLTSFPASMDLSKVTSLTEAWMGCTGLTSFPLLDTTNVTIFSNVWRGCSNLLSFPSLNMAKAAQIDSAWQGCSKLTTFPWINTSNLLTKADYAWSGCSGLTSFPGTPTHPTHPTTVINTSKVTNFSNTWSSCSGLKSFPSDQDTSAGTNFAETWSSCTGLLSFPLLNTGKGTNFIRSWSGCTGLAGYAFPALDMHLMSTGIACFGVTGGAGGIAISTSAYDAILNQLASGNGGSIPANTTPNVSFSGGNSNYTPASVVARQVTLPVLGWTITDGGL